MTKSEGSGFILVDSTRAGKRIPDALSKTVPIWCAVINRAMVLRHPEKTEGWDTELYCPPGAVSEQERTQIEKRLDGWARDLVVSSVFACTSGHGILSLDPRTRHTSYLPAHTLYGRSGSPLRLPCFPVSHLARK